MNYHSQQSLYIHLDTSIIKIGLAIAEIQKMANLLCHIAIIGICHALVIDIAVNMCLCYSAHFSNTIRHQDY